VEEVRAVGAPSFTVGSLLSSMDERPGADYARLIALLARCHDLSSFSTMVGGFTSGEVSASER